MGKRLWRLVEQSGYSSMNARFIFSRYYRDHQQVEGVHHTAITPTRDHTEAASRGIVVSGQPEYYGFNASRQAAQRLKQIYYSDIMPNRSDNSIRFSKKLEEEEERKVR
jgi:hypothetical protein